MSTTKNLNRGLALALILALLLCLLPVAAHAYSGSGTQSDPYIIANASDLATFRSNVNGGTSYSGVYFKLTADITTAQTAVIGTSSTYPFAGTFDGDGHTINVNLSGASRTALFGYVTGTIKNLIVTGSVTSTGSYSGGIVGYLQDGSVLNCGNEASVSATGGYSGGVVGYTGGTCTIDGCYNKGAISGGTRIGGIVGEQYTNVTVSNCYNLGSITGTSSSNGGVVGYGRAAVSNCYHAVGSVSTSYNGGSVGAIVGYMYSSGSMTNCYYVAVPSSLKGNSAGTAGTELTVAQMKAAASSLGNYYEADSNSINSGYPILYWQGSGSTPSTGIVDALNDLMDDYGDSILVWYDDEYSDSYDSGDTIYNDSIYLEPMELTDCTLDNETGDVYAVWTSSSAAVTIPSDGYGEATVTHSTSQALSVTMTARLTTVIDNVIYTSTDYVSYNFTISRDVGAATTRKVYVSIFNKDRSNPVVTGSGSRDIVAVPITVSGYENTICVDDALQKLHTDYWNGSGTGYASSNGTITTLWGITTTAVGIYRNDALTNSVTLETIADGDLITAFAYNSSSYSDRYLYFSNSTTTLTAGNSSALPAYYRTYSSSSGTSTTPSSVTIYKMDDSTGALSTTSEVSYSSGTVSTTSSAYGTYVLLAKKTAGLFGARYVPGVALVKVGLSDAGAVAADKASLTITTSGNNYYVSCTELPSSGANGTTITWGASPSGIISSAGLVTRPATDTQVTLTATITKGNASDTKSFIVTVPARETDYSSLLSSLASSLTPTASNVNASNVGDYLWTIMDVIAYQNKSNNSYISATDKASYYSTVTSFVNNVISGTGTDAQKSSDLAKAVIVLKALDYDNSGTNSGYSVDNISVTYNNTTQTLIAWMEDYTTAAINTALSAVNDQNDPDPMALLNYLPTASFVLMAELEEHGTNPTNFQSTLRNYLVNNQVTTGTDAGAWSTYTDIDAVILAGLGFYNEAFSSDTGVQSAINLSASYFSGKQMANGSFGVEKNSVIGNANSTAFVLIGLAAADQDAEGTAFSKNGNTVVDGILTYYNDSTGLFQYAGADNAMATEQAFRALVAWYGYDLISARFVVYKF